MVSRGWTALRNRAERGPSANYIRLKSKESARIHFLVKSEDDVVFFKQHYIDNKYLLCEDDTEDNTGDCKYCEVSEKRPSENYAFNVIDREDGKNKVLALNASHAQGILEFLDEYGSLTTKDYKISRTGVQNQTRYTFVPTKDIKKWDQVEKKAYEDRFNLEELFDPAIKNPKTVDTGKKKKKFTDETKASPPKAKITKSKAKPAPVDDEDDDEDEVETKKNKK